jgi:hypothetical protein
MATTMASGPLDELVALHEELGVLAALEEVQSQRERAGIADALFREPAILLRLGWAPVQIRAGSNQRHRHAQGRQAESLPCHPDTLRDALRRVGVAAWGQVQRSGVRALYARGLVRGGVYAIDGSGLGPNLRVVALVCVSATRPVIVAWRLLEGSASEKGKEAAVTRALIEQALELGGMRCIRLLLADGLYADGPLLAWLKYVKGIDALVRLPADRDLYADIAGLVRTGAIPWSRHSYTRTVRGHKERRTLDIAAVGDLTSWDSYVAAAASHGHPEATLWAGLIHGVPASPTTEPWALVSTRPWPRGYDAVQAFRPRWHIEDDAYRELKEGWGLEEQRWGRDSTVAHGRLTLTCLAFNTAQVYRLLAGERLAQCAIRRLRRERQPELGPAPAVIYLGGHYAVLALEDLLAALGVPVRESLLPALSPPPPASASP